MRLPAKTRASRYFFTTIVINDPAIAYAAEVLRRDRSATVDLRGPESATIYTATDVDGLLSDAPGMFGERASILIDYDRTVPLPEMLVPIVASTPKKKRRLRRAA